MVPLDDEWCARQNTARHRLSTLGRLYPQLYDYVQRHPIAVLYYDPARVAAAPPHAFTVNSIAELEAVSGAALLYSKKIVVLMRSSEHFVGQNQCYVSRIIN